MTAKRELRLPGRVAGLALCTAYQLGRLEIARALAEPERKAAAAHRRVAIWAQQLCALFAVHAHAAGRYLDDGLVYPGRDERGVGRLFIFNHRSGLDVLLALAHFEGNIVSRADLAGWPLIGFGARRIGTLFVDRGDARSGAALVARMTRALQAGQGVCIYPEGTAFADDEVHPLHLGGFRAAARAQAQIVPVGLCYAEAATGYGQESFAAHLKRAGSLDRVEAAIEAGEALPIGADADELRRQGRQALQALVSRARARLAAEEASRR